MRHEKKRGDTPPVPIERGVAHARYAYPAEEAKSAAALRFYCAGFEEVTASYHVCRPGFPQSGVEFVAAGKGRLTLAGKSYALSPGIFFGYGPGVAHEITTDPHERLAKYFFDFSGRDARRLLTGFVPDEAPRYAAHPAEMREWMELLLSQGVSAAPESSEVCVHLIRALEMRLRSASFPYGCDMPAGRDLFNRANKRVEEDPVGFRTAGELAHALRVTPEHLCRVFAAHGPKTPYAVILQARMRHAAALLREPGVAVKHVAAETGFTDPGHFSRVFKRVYGISPTEFAALQRR